jgi:hypothetical protein
MKEIMTSKGLLPISKLLYRETEEQVPAGRLVKKAYLLNGEIVKQDIEMHVSAAALSAVGEGKL